MHTVRPTGSPDDTQHAAGGGTSAARPAGLVSTAELDSSTPRPGEEQSLAPTPAYRSQLEVTPLASPSERIVSLDVARGIMLVASVVINAWYLVPAWFDHAPWFGAHPVDWVFPTFVALSGCGLAFAYKRRVVIGPTLRRFAVLLLFGLTYNILLQSLEEGAADLETLRLPGVLQLYAVLVCLTALLHLVLRGALWWLAATLTLAVGLTTYLAGYAQGCPGDSLTRACNPSRVWDVAVFGAQHIYHHGTFGHDPEGVVTLIGAMASVGAGATMGHFLVRSRRRPSLPAPARTSRLVAVLTASRWRTAATLMVLAVVWWGASVWAADRVPVMKRLWTPPFALSVAAAVCLALALLHLLVDGPDTGSVLSRIRTVVTWPLVALGRNSLLVYFGSHAVIETLKIKKTPAGQPWIEVVAERFQALGSPQLGLIIVWLAAWLVLAGILHAFRIYLRP